MKKILVFLFALLSFSAQAAESADGGKFKPGDMIMHHIADDYTWHFADGLVMPLPVILKGENGWDVFSSSNFYNANHELQPYNGYVMDHGHIYYADANGKPGTVTNEEGEVKPVGPFDLSITKNVASMLISVVLMFLVFGSIAGAYKKNRNQAPKGMQSFFEPIIIFIRDEIAKTNIGPKYERFMPYLLTVFFFIWFNNPLGLIPGGANLTGNIAVTLILATLTLLITVFSGNKSYWGHIFNTPGVPWWLKWGIPIMPLVEVIGIFTKPFSLMVRLFANITAGHIIILSLFSLIFIFQSVAIAPVSIAFAVFMNFLELFVALLQAYIFTLLSAMYFGGAVEEHDHHGDLGHGDAPYAVDAHH